LQRVYNLPGFVYFDHSIHVQSGIGLFVVPRRIDEMPLTYQVPSLLMEWCLDCHRHPEREIRPRAEVFNMKYQPPDTSWSWGGTPGSASHQGRRQPHQLFGLPSMITESI